MERKIGDTFEFEGKTFRVKEDKNFSCHSCFFNKKCTVAVKKTAGQCQASFRGDNKDVVFVKVAEGTQTEEPKERKIGEVFEYQRTKLQVVKDEGSSCDKCFFIEKDNCCSRSPTAGICNGYKRTDKKSVIFVEVKDEQPQEQAEQQDEQPQELNLCEILKNCPIGTKFWSPLLGEVELSFVHGSSISVRYYTGGIWDINSNGTTTLGSVTSPEIILFPSREQRDWTKVKYEPKKELPKTWEEFCITHDIKMSEYFIGETGNIFNANTGKRIPDISKTLLPSKEAAEAHLAYMQLHQLRNAWREGWLPDWTEDNQRKYVICSLNGEFSIKIRYTNRYFLAFQDEKRANEFLTNFHELIEEAGDLI